MASIDDRVLIASILYHSRRNIANNLLFIENFTNTYTPPWKNKLSKRTLIYTCSYCSSNIIINHRRAWILSVLYVDYKNLTMNNAFNNIGLGSGCWYLMYLWQSFLDYRTSWKKTVVVSVFAITINIVYYCSTQLTVLSIL